MSFLNIDKFGKRTVYTSARDDGKGNPITDVHLIGTKVVEQLTESDAVDGIITFVKNIEFIGIYNTDSINDGVFNVNGINIHVPSGESVDFHIGGTLSPSVNITGATSYIITRYV